MISRIVKLTSFELRKLAARRLALAAFALVALVAAVSPVAGRVIDTAGALAKGHAAVADPFKNGWTTLAGGISAALPFAVIVVLVFAGSTIAEEAQLGTLKALIVRPVRRTELLLAKTASLAIFALALVALMSGAAALVAWLNYGLGDVVDPDHTDYVMRSARDMRMFSAIAISLLFPSFLAVISWALLWSVTIDHPGYAVGASIGGFLFLALAAGLSDRVAPLIFVSYVGRPISMLGDIAEAFSGYQKEFWESLVPAIVVPLASAVAFLVAASLRLAARDVGD